MPGTSLGNYQLTKQTKIPYAAYILVADVIDRQMMDRQIHRQTDRHSLRSDENLYGQNLNRKHEAGTLIVHGTVRKSLTEKELF